MSIYEAVAAAVRSRDERIWRMITNGGRAMGRGRDATDISDEIDGAMAALRAKMEEMVKPSPIVGISAYAPIGGAEMASWVQADGSATPVAVGGRGYVTLTTGGIKRETDEHAWVKDIDQAIGCFLVQFKELVAPYPESSTLHWRVFPQLLEKDGKFAVRARLLIA